MTLYEELKARGLVAQITDEEIIDLINNGKATFYIGFDCTADSLTAGHFMALTLMKRLQMAGNKPIALIGGGTTMIGDPSGRTDMRKMLTKEDIAHNAACFKKQMEKFIDFSEGKALMLNNADWLLNLNYVELLRDVGACFSVNNMLRAKCYEQRMEKGLSFLEFNYMIMQSYDFYYMFQHYGCNMQFGGDDQWSNMLGGTELIRRKLGKDAYAMTITLLTDSQGKKMGKTAGNAVWLDPNKTSPFEFYQYWRNVGDADVMKCIRMLTFLPLEQIDEMATWKDQRLNEAKEILAYELTSMVHGKEEADKAQNAARALFSGAADTEHMPTTQLTEADLTDGSIGILTVMVKAGLAASNGEARRLVTQGGVLVDGEKVAAPTVSFTAEQLANGIVIKKGKKIYHKVTLESAFAKRSKPPITLRAARFSKPRSGRLLLHVVKIFEIDRAFLQLECLLQHIVGSIFVFCANQKGNIQIAGGDEQHFDVCHGQSVQGTGCHTAAGDHLFTEEVQLGVAHADERGSLGILVEIGGRDGFHHEGQVAGRGRKAEIHGGAMGCALADHIHYDAGIRKNLQIPCQTVALELDILDADHHQTGFNVDLRNTVHSKHSILPIRAARSGRITFLRSCYPYCTVPAPFLQDKQRH